MHSYDIKDVWMALQLAFYNFLITALVTIPVTVFFLLPGMVIVGPLLIIQCFLVYRANGRYFVDNETSSFHFPRSDIENSLADIIMLVPYWNLMRTRTVPLAEIENIYLDTKRWETTSRTFHGIDKNSRLIFKTIKQRKVLYTINIAGPFGSANLQFLDRQKRDELRNALQQSIKKTTGRNVDGNVSGLS